MAKYLLSNFGVKYLLNNLYQIEPCDLLSWPNNGHVLNIPLRPYICSAEFDRSQTYQFKSATWNSELSFTLFYHWNIGILLCIFVHRALYFTDLRGFVFFNFLYIKKTVNVFYTHLLLWKIFQLYCFKANFCEFFIYMFVF